ncbi:Possible membrane protein [hydrothermal vent metagenome]|uniref:Possible membrane protein n=1 Tax=hydrothermal vent metagenome TaxID=652676 RepID=A0A1W1CMR7_9ZZZZ
MLFTPQIITLYIINILFVVFATIAFINAVKILLHYDADATTPQQYMLEKKSYLSATIVKFIFYLKVPLFLFFIYTLDNLSSLLPGAMCAAGVVSATSYGTPLLFLKILNLYIFAFWIVLNNEDMKYESQPYLKKKFLLFCIAYFLLIAEIVLEGVMFFSMDANSVVDCCGKIFSTTSTTYMAELLGAQPSLLLSLFYGVFVLMFLFYILKNRYIYALLNILYLIIALVTLIAFFGTYIYELPTHHCPFCLLQRDYNYIGYLLYIILFIGTFFGSVIGVIDFKKEGILKRFRISLFYNTLYMLIVSYYPLSYYLKNGVWL